MKIKRCHVCYRVKQEDETKIVWVKGGFFGGNKEVKRFE